MQQVQADSDRSFSYLCIYRVQDKKFLRLADDALRQVTPAPKQRWAIGMDDQAYELPEHLDGRRYQDVYVIDLQTGERQAGAEEEPLVLRPVARRDALPLLRRRPLPHLRHGHAARAANITEGLPTSFVDTEDDHNVDQPPTRPIGWAKDGTSVLLSDNWDIWQVPVARRRGAST